MKLFGINYSAQPLTLTPPKGRGFLISIRLRPSLGALRDNCKDFVMTEKIKIEELPVSEEFLREKRLLQDRGELALIADGQPFRHLGYFSLNSGENHFRGGHYHKVKTEHFYVISGQLEVSLVDLETDERTTIRLQAGHRVEIKPMCAHKFRALERAQVIEYYDALYDREDDRPYHDFP